MEVILQQRFRLRLQQAIEIAEISPSDLARAMDATPQYVYSYTSGQRAQPSLQVVERFANALHIPPHALIDESDLVSHFHTVTGA